MQTGTPPLEAAGFRYGNLRQVTRIKLVLACHELLSLSSAACDDPWRPRRKWFCGSGFAMPANAGPCSSCALIVTAASAIAALPAGSKPASASIARPIAATNKVSKDGSIIATASGSIASAAAGRA